MTEHGFADMAVESARAFRSIMQAMAHPGSILELNPSLAVPVPLYPTTAAVALTLCDFQTPIWLAPALRGGEVARYLRFHAGSPIAENPEDAQFVFLSTEDGPQATERYAQGTLEYPDRSATLVIQVDGFGGCAVELTGPGIRSQVEFGVRGIATSFWEALAENHQSFPCGVDVIFTSTHEIAALPRSTAIRLREPA